jgi:hypothetical protein
MVRVLSLDEGFGFTKVVLMEDGVIVDRIKEMDSIVELSDADNYTNLNSLNDIIYEYEGKKYLVGGNALQAVSDNAKVLDVTDYDTFKYVAPILVNKYMKKFGGDFNRIVLTISYAFYDKSQDYKEYVAKKTGYPVENISVIPQGAAGKLAIDNIGLDPNNPSKKAKYLNYLIVDGGFNTVDISLVLEGRLMPINIKGYPGEGVIKIARQLIDHVKELSGEDISLSKARQIIETRKYVLRGKVYDVASVIDEYINKYIIGLSQLLNSKYGTQLNNIEMVIIFGGLGELIRSKMDVWDTLYNKSFVRIPTEDAEYFNVLGGVFYEPKK